MLKKLFPFFFRKVDKRCLQKSGNFDDESLFGPFEEKMSVRSENAEIRDLTPDNLFVFILPKLLITSKMDVDFDENSNDSSFEPSAVKRQKTEDDTFPEDSDDEDRRAEMSGAKNYPNGLWSRLKNMTRGDEKPAIDIWEFKMDADAVTMTFTCDGEKFKMYFTSRSTVDYEIRQNFWIPRHNTMYGALRTRLLSLPKNVIIDKLVIYNSPECEVEDCLIELMFMKSWSCRELEYIICRDFQHPHHLRKLVKMFKPTEITVALRYGPFHDGDNRRNHPRGGGSHNHLSASFDFTCELGKDFQWDCDQAVKANRQEELSKLYKDAVVGKRFGMGMLGTLCSIRTFVTLIIDGKSPKVLKKFAVKGPSNDKACVALQQLLRQEPPSEMNRKKKEFADGWMTFVCVRNEPVAAPQCSLGMSTTAFKMKMSNEQMLTFTKTTPTFHCCFRTNVDERGVLVLIEEWHKGDRHLDDIQLQIDKVIDSKFINHLGADRAGSPKWIKLSRNVTGKKQTMYIDRERLATRHLSIRVKDSHK
ncbi:hypothetical protein B9Z55_009100 [Caenorhabditis nigoni]|uniref:Uncharacterized protein n=3 Tax=Caenorhabditis nigoni TaxID=1611254 RepID=A0A2G5UR09_9PELO|nr:hypothetical protein B9Z55_009100 [Caenorhabditis nigoni]